MKTEIDYLKRVQFGAGAPMDGIKRFEPSAIRRIA